MRASVIGVVVGLILAAVGCEGGEEDFISCSLDPKVVELGQCLPQDSEEVADGTIQNCAIQRHPHCPVGVCLAWQGEDPYCTTQCVDNSDCPEESTCELYSTAGDEGPVRFCVLLPEEE